MALSFPNRGRSYDEGAERVRFIGHDGTFEIPFFIGIDALKETTKSAAGDEAGYLAAFDAARSAIETVAYRAYRRGRDKMVILTASDFR